MNEAVEIQLRNIIQRHSAPLELRQEEPLEGMSLEEILLLEQTQPAYRIFDERKYDQMVFELYCYMKGNPPKEKSPY